MAKQIAVVTGATSGIGLETARGLALGDYHVVMACRNMEKASALAMEISEQSGNSNIEVLTVDMASLQSIRDFAERFTTKYDQLDVLINNAGVFCDRFEKTEDGFEMTMGVNYLGSFLLTRLLLPVIKETPEARIINISSKAAYYARLKTDENIFTDKKSGFRAYSKSKLAQLLFNIELAGELKRTDISANAAYPGRVATKIWQGSSLLMKIVEPLMMRNSISAKEGAETGLYLAMSPDLEGLSGYSFHGEDVLDYNKTCLNKKLRKELIKLSFDAVGLRDDRPFGTYY